MSKPLSEIIERLNKSNDAYHEAVEELLLSEGLNPEQKLTVGLDIHNVFRSMKKIKDSLHDYMS